MVLIVCRYHFIISIVNLGYNHFAVPSMSNILTCVTFCVTAHCLSYCSLQLWSDLCDLCFIVVNFVATIFFFTSLQLFSLDGCAQCYWANVVVEVTHTVVSSSSLVHTYNNIIFCMHHWCSRTLCMCSMAAYIHLCTNYCCFYVKFLRKSLVIF